MAVLDDFRDEASDEGSHDDSASTCRLSCTRSASRLRSRSRTTLRQRQTDLWFLRMYFGSPNDASDYFFFQTTSRGQITIDLNDHTGQGIQLLLYYPEGNLVGQDITPPYRLEYTGNSGRYYVRNLLDRWL